MKHGYPTHLLKTTLALAAFCLCAWPRLLPAEKVDGLALPFKSVTVSSPVQEIIAEIAVEEGDAVKKNDVLARLRDEKEKIDFRRYEKVYEKRQFDYEASQNLLKENIMSREQALAAEAELELAKVDYDLAKVNLGEKTIQSPLDGIVIRKFLEDGESVDRVEPLFEIVNIDQLYLQFFLEPRLVRNLGEGDEIAFSVASDSGTTKRAKVDFISASADASSGLFRVKLLVENAGHKIKAGLRVTADFPSQ